MRLCALLASCLLFLGCANAQGGQQGELTYTPEVVESPAPLGEENPTSEIGSPKASAANPGDPSLTPKNIFESPGLCWRPTPEPVEGRNQFVDPGSGLSFDYPNNWYVASAAARANDADYSVGLRSVDPFGVCQLDGYQSDQFGIDIYVVNNPGFLSLEKWEAAHPIDPSRVESRSSTTISGRNATYTAFRYLDGIQAVMIRTVVRNRAYHVVGAPAGSPLAPIFEEVTASLRLPE